MQKYKHRVNDFTFRKDLKLGRRQLLYLKFLHTHIRTKHTNINSNHLQGFKVSYSYFNLLLQIMKKADSN
jgi:hypothetical protein